jgi:hypothetical protein
MVLRDTLSARRHQTSGMESHSHHQKLQIPDLKSTPKTATAGPA